MACLGKTKRCWHLFINSSCFVILYKIESFICVLFRCSCFSGRAMPLLRQMHIEGHFYQCNLQVQLLFENNNCTCNSFSELTSEQILLPTTRSISNLKVLRTQKAQVEKSLQKKNFFIQSFRRVLVKLRHLPLQRFLDRVWQIDLLQTTSLVPLSFYFILPSSNLF